ncbi:MAG: transposase, partial [Deltaproteobacteria bacterium]|nr:transposase [Deltaproteobacteria bacterium]
MGNHVHLLIEAGEKGSISKIMQGITLAHTRYF